MTGEDAALALHACDFQLRAVTLQRVFDNSQPQARTTAGSRARAVDAVKTLRKTWQMLPACERSATAQSQS